MEHIQQVLSIEKELKKTKFLEASAVERLAGEMKKREEIANEKGLSKLTKLKRITAHKDYDVKEDGWGGEMVAKAGTTALRHTVQLINQIIRFTDCEDKNSIYCYSRKVEDFEAHMEIYKNGFHLVITKGEETILEKIIGSGLFKAGFISWGKLSEDVMNQVDLGLLRRNWSTRSDTFEAEYKVHPENAGHIITRIRKEFYNNGLISQYNNINGAGWTCYFKQFFRDHYEKDVISIKEMFHGNSVADFKEAVQITNAILKSEGYTESQSYGNIPWWRRKGE